MSFDELAELMSEPPGGENHGRVRTESGWRDLSATFDLDLPYIIDDPEWRSGRRRQKTIDEIAHGTRSAYVNDRCRCPVCREANAEYIRRFRANRRPQ